MTSETRKTVRLSFTTKVNLGGAWTIPGMFAALLLAMILDYSNIGIYILFVYYLFVRLYVVFVMVPVNVWWIIASVVREVWPKRVPETTTTSRNAIQVLAIGGLLLVCILGACWKAIFSGEFIAGGDLGYHGFTEAAKRTPEMYSGDWRNGMSCAPMNASPHGLLFLMTWTPCGEEPIPTNQEDQ